MPEREPLTEEAIIEKLSDWIVEKRLATPAVFMLESLRPMNFIGSQFLVFFQPYLTVLFDPAGLDTVIQTMEKRENIGRLLIRIEEKDLALQQVEQNEKASRRIARGCRRVEKQSAAYARKAARRAERERS